MTLLLTLDFQIHHFALAPAFAVLCVALVLASVRLADAFDQCRRVPDLDAEARVRQQLGTIEEPTDMAGWRVGLKKKNVGINCNFS